MPHMRCVGRRKRRAREGRKMLRLVPVCVCVGEEWQMCGDDARAVMPDRVAGSVLAKMFPDEVVKSDPALEKVTEELAGKRICRLCLAETRTLLGIDAVSEESRFSWRMKIACCYPMSTISCGNLPQFICEACSIFVNKSFEFNDLCRNVERLLFNYQLTGKWCRDLQIPKWLRSESCKPEAAGDQKPKTEECECAKKKRKIVRRKSSSSSTEGGQPTSQLSLQSPTITQGSPDIIQQLQPTGAAYPSAEASCRPHPSPQRPQFQAPGGSPPAPYPNAAARYRPYHSPRQASCPVPSGNVNASPAETWHRAPPYQNTIHHHLQQDLRQQTTIVHSPYPVSPYNVSYSQPSPLNQSNQLNALQQFVDQYSGQATVEPMGGWCSICPCRFVKRKHLQWHMRRHRDPPIQRRDEFLANHPTATDCWLCGQVFETHAQLVAHLEQHYRVGCAHACDFCKLVFLDKEQWTVHVRDEHALLAEQTLDLNRSIT